jgi:hypothetical protein
MAEVVKVRRRTRALRALRLAIEFMLPIAAAVALAASGTVGGRIGLFGYEPAAGPVLIAIGAVLLVIEAALVGQRRLVLRRLQAEEPSLRRRAELGEAAPLRLMRIELKGLSRRGHYYSNERISLYREEEDGFTLVARYSAGPRFDQSLGRPCLPLEAGILGKAWEKGSAAVGELASPGAGEPPNLQWLRAQERQCAIEQAVAAGFTMRSQSYVAFRLATPDQEAQGAIVFESTVPLSGQGAAKVKPCMTEAELEAPVKEASERLAQLLADSRSLTREEIRVLLERQQGPNRAEPQAAGSSG